MRGVEARGVVRCPSWGRGVGEKEEVVVHLRPETPVERRLLQTQGGKLGYAWRGYGILILINMAFNSSHAKKRQKNEPRPMVAAAGLTSWGLAAGEVVAREQPPHAPFMPSLNWRRSRAGPGDGGGGLG